jgi:hypothetical protein
MQLFSKFSVHKKSEGLILIHNGHLWVGCNHAEVYSWDIQGIGPDTNPCLFVCWSDFHCYDKMPEKVKKGNMYFVLGFQSHGLLGPLFIGLWQGKKYHDGRTWQRKIIHFMVARKQNVRKRKRLRTSCIPQIHASNGPLSSTKVNLLNFHHLPIAYQIMNPSVD